MRYGILADIHGNLEALNAVIEICKDEGVRKYYCAGDLVGYGASPNECLNTIRQLNFVAVAGNHDWAVCGKLNPNNFSSPAFLAVQWTRNQLSIDDLNYLSSLELTYDHDEFQMVHGSLNKSENFIYIKNHTDALDSFYLMKKSLCIVAHTHIPQILIKKKDLIEYGTQFSFQLLNELKYIVNIGSVGQPRDGNPKASFCIMDSELRHVEIRRVEYDVKTAQSKILKAGLPEILAQRLSIGH